LVHPSLPRSIPQSRTVPQLWSVPLFRGPSLTSLVHPSSLCRRCSLASGVNWSLLAVCIAKLRLSPQNLWVTRRLIVKRTCYILLPRALQLSRRSNSLVSVPGGGVRDQNKEVQTQRTRSSPMDDTLDLPGLDHLERSILLCRAGPQIMV
jgi:hypothetical protein